MILTTNETSGSGESRIFAAENPGKFDLRGEERFSRNDFSDLSLKEHVELYLDDGLSEKEAIKRVAFERKIQKSIVYKEYHLNK